MPPVLVSPLIVLREHPSGSVSTHPASNPSLVAFGPDRETALGELRLFLSAYLPKAGADATQQLVIPEEARLERFTVALPYRSRAAAHRPMQRRLRSPVAFDCVVVPGRGGARWVLVSALDHVLYVGAEQVSEMQAAVAREIERLFYASAFEGGRVLDFLPPLTTSIARLEVELDDVATDPEQGKARSDALKRRHARSLLERVGRRVHRPRDAALHREQETWSLRALLESETRSSVVLVGPEGAGKSALVQAVAESRAIYATSGAELVAGQSFVGQIEERMQAVLEAAELLDAVLYFEALEDLFAGQTGGHQDLASAMRRYLADGRVRVIGELTAERYDRLQHRNAGFFSSLQKLRVEPLGLGQTLSVLATRAKSARRREQPSFTPEASRALLGLVERYYPHAAQPGSAVRMAEEVAATCTGEITPEEVYRATSARTGVPEFLLRDERSLHLGEVVKHFQAQLMGQREAVQQVAEVLCRVKAGVSHSGKPLATFLFVGPTGVGKTELAKALARFLFGSAERLARFDMSEYRGPGAAERLIRGTDSADGVLTRRVRQEPFTVLLLDEIEKADSAVFDLLLQVCGEGRLSDAQGKLAYFNNAIIIMTSNLGSQHQVAPVGFGSERSVGRDHYLQEVRRHFRPEFINRIDRIVPFSSLSRDEMREVTELSIERLKRREGLEERDVKLTVSREAALKLGEDGYSQAYGARGLRRHLEQALVAPLATVLSSLGEQARGVELRVTRAEADAGEGAELTRLEHDGLVVTAHHRPDTRKHNTAGAVEISALRRDVTKWARLPPVKELRERVAELSAELASAERWNKHRTALSRVFGELSAEHSRLSELLRPLDAAKSELEQIEAMVIGSLSEGGAPDLFAADAEHAYERYESALIPALMAQVTERELTLLVHELDDGKSLQRFILPLLESAKERKWEVRLHLDRDPSAVESAWPKNRRWGPPQTGDDYLRRFGAGQERPFRNLMVRVRGPAAGALLSFASGRWRYPLEKPDEFTELWVRLGPGRYELEANQYDSGWLWPEIDSKVGRKVGLRVDFAPPSEPRSLHEFEVSVSEANVFRLWERAMFRTIIEHVASGAPYLSDGER